MKKFSWSASRLSSGGERHALRGLILVACLTSGTIVASCDYDRATAPGSPSNAPDPGQTGPGLNTTGPDETGAYPPVQIPIAPTSDGNGAAVDWMPILPEGVSLPPGTKFVVTVTGFVTTEPNPAYTCCFTWSSVRDPFVGSFGPSGVHDPRPPAETYLRVAAMMRQNYPWAHFDIALKPNQPGAAGPITVQSDTFVTPGGGTLWVSRSRMYPGGSGCSLGNPFPWQPPPCKTPTGMAYSYSAPFFAMSGGQLAIVSIITAKIKLTASKNEVEYQETVTFTAAPNPSGQLAVTGWKWVPDGEPDQPMPPPVIPECDPKSPVCEALMTESGRMWVYGTIDGRRDSASAAVKVDHPQVVLEPVGSGMIPPSRTFGEPFRDIRVSVVGARGPLPGREVTLTLSAVDRSRGHDHSGGDRPAGGLDLNVVNTGPTGVVTVAYAAPDVAGDIVLTGTSPRAKDAKKTLQVGLDNLIEIRHTIAGFEYIGYQGKPHLVNHWGLPVLQREYARLSEEYQKKLKYFAEHPDSIPSGARLPSLLGANDMSLPWGGRLDFKSNWGPPHKSHRHGFEGDFDIREGDGDDFLSDLIHSIWVEKMKHKFGDERDDANHVHLKLGPDSIPAGVSALARSPKPAWLAASTAAALLCIDATCAASQTGVVWPRHDQLQARVTASASAAHGDTIVLRYGIANSPTSAQPANMLIVRSDVKPVDMAAPAAWVPDDGPMADSAAMAWSGLGRTGRVAAGASISGLTARVVGLVDIAPYRVRGYAKPPSLEDADDESTRPPSVWADAVAGVTIGVRPVPPGATAEALLARLSGLLREACDLRWVSSAAICTSLRVKLDAAAQSLERGDRESAAGQLQAFQHEVRALTGTYVTDEGAALLGLNALAIVRRL